MLEDCTADEASWVSEVYDEILQKTRDEAFVELLKQSVERFPEEDKLLNMSRQLEIAIDNYLDV